ncbi:MAG: hypothetical protein MI757_16950 [Pirellulales bacterium]|nr:hypothetical protein [Pirellulales bacterium]
MKYIIVVVAILAIASPYETSLAQPAGADLPAVSSPYLVLIRDPVVQEHLDLTDKQRDAVRQLTDRVDGPLWRTRAMSSQNGAIEVARLITEAKRRMSDILTPKQQSRMAQIELRAIGMKSLFLASVRRELELKESQLKSIAETLNSTKEEQAKLKKRHGNNTKKLDAELEKLFADEKEKVAGVLDQAQQRGLRKLVGEPFDLSKLGNVRFKAPEFDGADGWINTRGLRMADLRGRVTVLHFWTYG